MNDEQVRVVTRSGGGPEHPAIERVAADATDGDRLTELTAGAAAPYNCASPLYHRWLTDWPPLAAALLTAAERTGATLAVTSNLYGYGPVDSPITADTPLAATDAKLRVRADMWRAALALHDAGRIRVTEVRGSDYIEARPLLAGRRTLVPGALGAPHTWTSIKDVARTLTTAAIEEQAWGRAWLVPSHAPMTVRELADRFTRVHGAPAPRLARIPYPMLWGAGLISPMTRELRATYYQSRGPSCWTHR